MKQVKLVEAFFFFVLKGVFPSVVCYTVQRDTKSHSTIKGKQLFMNTTLFKLSCVFLKFFLLTPSVLE